MSEYVINNNNMKLEYFMTNSRVITPCAPAVGNYDDTTSMKFKALMRDADYGNQLRKLWILTITNDEIL